MKMVYGLVYGQPPFVTKLLPGHEKTVPNVYRRFLLLVVHIVQIVLVEPVPAVVEHYLVVAKGEGVDIVPAHKAHYKACGVRHSALVGPGLLVGGQVQEPVRVPGELLLVLIIGVLACEQLDIRRVPAPGGYFLAPGVVYELYLGVGEVGLIFCDYLLHHPLQ